MAELMSGHPSGQSDPRFQRNNPMNTLALRPAEMVYSTPYSDGAVRHFLPGVQFTDARGTPDPSPAALTPEQERAGDFLARFTTPLPMGQSQVAQGDPQAGLRRGIGGMHTSLSGAREQRGGHPPRLA